MVSNEGKALDAVVKLLERRDGKNRSGVRRPEQDGCGPPVDLRLRLGSREYAFEHTQIDPFPGQIGLGHRFAEFINPVERALSGTLPGSARYYLIFPRNANLKVDKARLDEIRQNFIAWVREKAQLLHERASEKLRQEPSAKGLNDEIYEVPPDFPFPVRLSRRAHSSVSQRNSGVLIAARFTPENLEQLRGDRLRQALCDKCPKLQCCKEEGARTVLILESDDIALTNSDAVGKQLRPLLECRTDLPDEVYLVEIDHELWQVRPMKCDEQRWLIGAPPTQFHIDDLTDLTKEHE